MHPLGLQISQKSAFLEYLEHPLYPKFQIIFVHPCFYLSDIGMEELSMPLPQTFAPPPTHCNHFLCKRILLKNIHFDYYQIFERSDPR
jgi:hypothetical protein